MSNNREWYLYVAMCRIAPLVKIGICKGRNGDRRISQYTQEHSWLPGLVDASGGRNWTIRHYRTGLKFRGRAMRIERAIHDSLASSGSRHEQSYQAGAREVFCTCTKMTALRLCLHVVSALKARDAYIPASAPRRKSR